MIQAILDYITTLFDSSAYIRWKVAIEMALIGAGVYMVLRFLHGTRGANLLQGLITVLVGGFLVLHVLVDLLGLGRLDVLLEPLVWVVLLTTLVVFQPELRRGMMRLGEARFRRNRPSDIDKIARPISAACVQLSKNKIGALIAIEQSIQLQEAVESGMVIDCQATPEMFETIFFPNNAIHDGGVIMKGDRITFAACIFPLTQRQDLNKSVGTRHRAAIGLTEETDAVVVVVSEETGAISYAYKGNFTRGVTLEELRAFLTSVFVTRAKRSWIGSLRSWRKRRIEPAPAVIVKDEPAGTTEELVK
jgi:diadenylate cyclase